MEYREQYLAFYRDWINSGEDMIPWVVERDPSDFEAYLKFLYSEDSEEKLSNANWVPHSTYWLIDGEGNIVGAVNIRHRLNQKLFNSGGHIGYGVCPSQRRRGYATVLLSSALEKAKMLDIDRVLVVCDKGNIGSEKTIIKNGGLFESEYTEANGNVVRRFWIHLAGD
jgi:predicted acetyltransferase